jgi:hypothetical protein
MTENAGRTQPKVRPYTYVALGVSVFVAAAWWFFMIGQSSDLYAIIFGYNWIGVTVVLVAMGVVGIIVDIGAGRRGGMNGLISILAGLILVSPLVAIGVSSIVG